jgi:hypothetical protein
MRYDLLLIENQKSNIQSKLVNRLIVNKFYL